MLISLDQPNSAPHLIDSLDPPRRPERQPPRRHRPVRHRSRLLHIPHPLRRGHGA